MKKLSEVKWCPFPIEDIFTVSPGIRLTKDAMVEGNRPFIGASDSNNGITAFCGNTNKSLDSNVLGVNYNGSVVENFYHPYEAIFSDDVKRLHLKEHVGNKYIYLFIKNIILKQKEKFQYGYKFNGDRMLRTSIKLPIGSDGKPDFDFMEQYMKAIEKKLLKRYQQYLVDTKRNTMIDKKLTGCDKIEWKEFKIGDMFEVKRPVGRNKDDYQNGEIFFVASGAANNGVMKCCAPKMGENLDKGNCLTVSPVDGTCFYQPVDFLGRGGAGSSILMLYHKSLILNQNVGLFFAKMINVSTSQYNYGRMANTDSIRRSKFQLPVLSDGQPDYEYMEQYMKAIEHRLINRYIEKRLKTL